MATKLGDMGDGGRFGAFRLRWEDAHNWYFITNFFIIYVSGKFPPTGRTRVVRFNSFLPVHGAHFDACLESKVR